MIVKFLWRVLQNSRQSTLNKRIATDSSLTQAMKRFPNLIKKGNIYYIYRV